MSEGDIQYHYTCTSTPLDQTQGSRPENILAEVLNKRYQELYGTPISQDPIVARIQREQALVGDKRNRRGS